MTLLGGVSRPGIPLLDPHTGCLPPGRFPATLEQVEAAFVRDPYFAASTSRAGIWRGFAAYRATWDLAESLLGNQLVVAWWIGGSFLTSAVEVKDIDVTPIIDRAAWNASRGKPGMRHVKALVRHRASVRDTFGVEPFVLLWSVVPCTLFPGVLSTADQDSLRDRGGLDAWWQRMRPLGPKGSPGLPTRFAERGYVEVER